LRAAGPRHHGQASRFLGRCGSSTTPSPHSLYEASFQNAKENRRERKFNIIKFIIKKGFKEERKNEKI